MALALAPMATPRIKYPGGKYPPAFKKEVVDYADKHGDLAASKKFERGESQIWQWRRRLKGLPTKLTEAEKAAKAGGIRALAKSGKELRHERFHSAEKKAAAVAYAEANGVPAAALKFGVHHTSVRDWTRALKPKTEKVVPDSAGAPMDGSVVRHGKDGRRYYSEEFKQKALALATELGSQKKAGEQLGIHSSLIGGWRMRERESKGSTALVPSPRTPRQLVFPTDIISAGEQVLESESYRLENEKLWELVAIMRGRRR